MVAEPRVNSCVSLYFPALIFVLVSFFHIIVLVSFVNCVASLHSRILGLHYISFTSTKPVFPSLCCPRCSLLRGRVVRSSII